MKNKYLRLFVAQTKLMTAEKMRLDRFCQYGEFLAYKIALPPDPELDLGTCTDVKFVFDVELENIQYHFTDDNFSQYLFEAFEDHLSEYLNELFRRKTEFERDNEMFREVMEKLLIELTEEQRRCLATNIDANTTNVLRILGVASE